MDCINHGVSKSQTLLSDFHFHIYLICLIYTYIYAYVYIFMYLYIYVCVYMYICIFRKHLGCFHILVIVVNASLNLEGQISLQNPICFPLAIYL